MPPPQAAEDPVRIAHEEEKAMKTRWHMGLTIASLGMAAAMPLAFAETSESVRPVFEHVIPNIDGKRMVAVVVSYPPGAKSLAHRHAKSAFIYAYVLSGTIRSEVDDQPAKVYRTGEGFYEEPGSHHRISENASDKEPASLLAVFVVDTDDKALTTPDPK
jgi:quercetin dioxygenase-like cupin family protein